MFPSKALAGLCIAAALTGTPAAALETRGYAISYLYAASYAEDGDCPNGFNPSTTAGWINGMRALGLPEDKITSYFDGGTNMKQGERQQIGNEYISNRGRIDGKAVNIYANPLARPYLKNEPRFHTTTSKYGFGFNLDGKGAASPNSFEDPESHEKGVNNEFYRVMSCMQSFRAKPPFRASANAMLAGSAYSWTMARSAMPAWLMTISGEDLSKDGDVTVSFFRSFDRMNIDAKAEPFAGDTFRIDPDAASNTFKGKLKDGVITAEPNRSFYMNADQLIFPEFRLSNAHLRVAMKADGGLDAVIGGYQPFVDIYWSLANPGQANEVGNAMDSATFYVMLKKHADANPDPQSGQNTDISAAYRIEAVSAFVVPGERR